MMALCLHVCLPLIEKRKVCMHLCWGFAMCDSSRKDLVDFPHYSGDG